MLKKLQAGIAIVTVGVSCNASAYTADGDLNDWLGHGSTPGAIIIDDTGPGITNAWLVPTGSSTGNQQYVIENEEHPENDGNTWNGNVAGGQLYDAEAIYTDLDATHLYVAIVTGTPESLSGTNCGGSQCWDPGDIAIYVGDNAIDLTDPVTAYNYGLETTGRVGYLPDGQTSPSGFEAGLSAGDLFDTTAANSWAYGTQGEVGTPTSLIGGTEIGTVAFNYSDNSEFTSPDQLKSTSRSGTTYYRNPDGSRQWDTSPDSGWHSHYVIEAAIPRALIGLTTGENDVHYALAWTQNCGNDQIKIAGFIDGTGPGGGPSNIPEPAPLAIMALGLIGIGVTRKYAVKQKK